MKINFLRILPTMFVLWLLLAVQACEKDPTPEIPLGAAGYFVVNEGGFGNSNTSISFYDRDKDAITNDVFAAKNGRPLGDQAQSLTVFEGKAYITVQNSAKVEVINADDFSSIKTITEGIESPRYFLGITSTKGYVSDWGTDGETGTVKVIDLGEMKVTKTIPTGKGANKMLLKDGKVYVANDGGFGTDNKISIIDTSNDEVTGTIAVGDNPHTMQFDKDGNLWVAGIGNYFDTNPSLSKIGADNEEALRLTLPNIVYIPISLSINKTADTLYYNYDGGVYALPTSATELPADPIIEKDFYGLAVDPFTNEIIGMEALNFSSAGKIYLYKTNGTARKSYEVGIAPNGIGFK